MPTKAAVFFRKPTPHRSSSTAILSGLPAATARAVPGAVKTMTGYGPKGKLEGQRLFDSKSVKQRLYRNAGPDAPPAGYRPTDMYPGRFGLRKALAGARTPAEVAAVRKTLSGLYQMPGVLDRIPGGGLLRRVGNRLNRNPIAHPVVQSVNTVRNALDTPVTRLLRGPADAMASRIVADPTAGRTSRVVAKGVRGAVQGADAAAGFGAKTLMYGGAALAVPAAATAVYMAPYRNAVDAAREIDPHYDTKGDPAFQELRANPLRAAYDMATDGSATSGLVRDIQSDLRPHNMAMAADFLVNPTTLASSASNQLRSLSLGGQLTNAALRSIADPTKPPYEEITKARLNQHAIPLLRAAMSDNPAPTDRLAARLMAGPIDTRLRDEALKRNMPLAEKVDKERLRRRNEASAVARDALKRIDDVPSAGKAVQTAAGLANAADLLANNPFAPKTGLVPYLLRGPLKRDNRDRLQQAVTPYAEQADRAVRDIQTTGNDAVTAANAKTNAVPYAAPTFKDRLITPFDDRVGTTAPGGKTNNPADIPAPVQPFLPGRILKSVADRGMDKGGAAKPYRRRVEVFALDADGKVFGSAYPDGGFGGYGGGIDAGETVAAAAAREFLEETGRTIAGVRRLAVPSVRIDWGPDDAGGSAEKKRRREEYRGSETVYVTAELGPPDPDADKERDPHNRPAGKTVSLAAALATLTPGDEGDGIEAANAGRRAAVELLKTERQAPPLAVLKMAAAFRPCPVASLLSLFQGPPVG